MVDSRDADTNRTAVKTYVPAYQKEQWERHAQRLGMTQSEFVRTMVQAGRRDFEVPAMGDMEAVDSSREAADNPEAGGLEERVREVLSTSEYLAWDELVARLTDDIEDRLETALQELQSADRVRYSGRHGGYTLVRD
jgi:hypothetical protein